MLAGDRLPFGVALVRAGEWIASRFGRLGRAEGPQQPTLLELLSEEPRSGIALPQAAVAGVSLEFGAFFYRKIDGYDVHDFGGSLLLAGAVRGPAEAVQRSKAPKTALSLKQKLQ